MKNENLSEVHQVLAQSEMPTAGTNKVAQKDAVDQQLSKEILDLVEQYDFETDIWQFTERQITIHNESEWSDPTAEFLKQKAIGSLANKSVTIIPIKIGGYPAAMEMRCQVIDSSLEVDVLLGEEIFDTSAAFDKAISNCDLKELITEFEKYNRKFSINGEVRFVTESELVKMANEPLEHLFEENKLHLPGTIAINYMTENGREMQGGFMARRTIDGVSLAFTYFGATGADRSQIHITNKN